MNNVTSESAILRSMEAEHCRRVTSLERTSGWVASLKKSTTVDSDGFLMPSAAAVTSTPMTKISQRSSSNASYSLNTSSPRLKAFEGDAWIRSPRTGYTYVNSPTYRINWTPDREEVPMPHMARYILVFASFTSFF